jgi:hypothetical protein
MYFTEVQRETCFNPSLGQHQANDGSKHVAFCTSVKYIRLFRCERRHFIYPFVNIHTVMATPKANGMLAQLDTVTHETTTSDTQTTNIYSTGVHPDDTTISDFQ